ncbi:c-type cytochrome [Variovorax arabinosiphilus]|uniref:c-type cytochrome n=1 Tax=Variovorax arabinosiphilus TaxID=3053498 RepID=UPI0025759CE5|nr:MULTISPECIES: cytochrome c [unclassified Variovorax]MDM0119387.1 cytochrome c [Variovorax sp. J2L1-78]MDM0129813.1 cytochrome c [Variovorax sp. J2L1-63]MDM0232401.1 cytochrome c [Variovorax sp. J2R1-6]
MNAATKTRLRVTGFGIVVAALLSTWAFGQKASPVTGGMPAAPVVATTGASTAVSSDPTVERGRYLARAGDCVSCHTGPSNVPFAGGLPMATPFGTIVSSNITPDKGAGIGDYTEADFARALREGVRRDGQHLYPAMPYPSFARLNDEDMHALYVYFQQGVAASADKPPPTDLPWPFSMRWLMMGWNLLYLDKGVYQPDSARSAEWNRGAYLVQGLGHCGDCHTPRSLAGGVKAANERQGDSYLAGTLIDGWLAQPLRHTERGSAAQWSTDDMVAYLQTGRTAHTAAFGPMAQVVQNSTQYMRREDLASIATYLQSIGTPPATPAPLQAAVVAAATAHPSTQALRAGTVEGAGGMVYLNNCNACHRSSGAGADGVFPSLAGNSVVNAKDPTSLIRIVLAGSAMPSTESRPSALAMPGFGWRLGDENVAALLSFVRSSWGNRGEAVTPAQVAKVRKEIAPR